jgi:hypothetical protein
VHSHGLSLSYSVRFRTSPASRAFVISSRFPFSRFKLTATKLGRRRCFPIAPGRSNANRRPIMERERRLRRWALPAMVNLGAVVVAVLTFGAWKRFESAPSPATHIEGSTKTFYELADDVGYIPKANKRATERELVGDRAIYDVAYTTGPDHFRVVPDAADKSEACVLLFGDSFTFGIGVNDDETFAAQIVKRSAGRVTVKNLAVGGWGPHQFLAGLQSGRFQRAVTCRPTDAIYLMIPTHIYRSIGADNNWDTHGPRYRLGPDGRPVRAGRLGDPGDFSLRRLVGLNAMSEGEAADLTVALLLEAASDLRYLYPGIRVHLISWHNGGAPEGLIRAMEHKLAAAGLMPLPLEAIIPLYRFQEGEYTVDPLDTHPNVSAHRRIADFIIRLINAADD